MADISAFPTMTPVEESAILTRTFTASGAITAGMVVAFSATGVSNTVVKAVAEAGGQAIGVALTSAASGAKVNVCVLGICNVANADDTTGIDAGDLLIQNDATVGGTVVAAGSGAATQYTIGIALEDIAGGSYGKAFICPAPLTVHA